MTDKTISIRCDSYKMLKGNDAELAEYKKECEALAWETAAKHGANQNTHRLSYEYREEWVDGYLEESMYILLKPIVKQTKMQI